MTIREHIVKHDIVLFDIRTEKTCRWRYSAETAPQHILNLEYSKASFDPKNLKVMIFDIEDKK